MEGSFATEVCPGRAGIGSDERLCRGVCVSGIDSHTASLPPDRRGAIAPRRPQRTARWGCFVGRHDARGNLWRRAFAGACAPC